MLARNPSVTGEDAPLAGGSSAAVLAHSGGSGMHQAATVRGGGGVAWLQPRSHRALVLAAGALILLAFCGGWQLGASSSSGRDADAVMRAVSLSRLNPSTVDSSGAGQGAAASGTEAAAAAQPPPPPPPAAAAAKPPQTDQQSCAYGSLRGIWVDGGQPGTRWRLLDPRCQLRNLLARYEAPDGGGADGSGGDDDDGSSSSSSSSSETPLEKQSNAADDGDGAPPLRLLLLSDSVDRYVAGYLCAWVGGKQRAHVARDVLPPAASDGDAAAAAAAAAAAGAALGIPASQQPPSDGGPAPAAEAGKHRRLRRRALQGQWRRQKWRQRRRRLHQQQEQQQQEHQQQEQQQQQQQRPTNVYATAYSLHECVSASSPLRVASSYFPGVHPDGPWHRNVTQSARARIDSAAALWREYAGGAPPDLVAVSSLLWDLARLWFHERAAVEGPALSPSLVDAWAANFTEVVAHARRAFPGAKVFVTHTTLTPRVDPATGVAVKPYLGRAYYVAQLNAAVAAAVRRMGGDGDGGDGGDQAPQEGGGGGGGGALGLVDYAAVGARFAANQTYLADLIHPGRDVGLELANVYLNLAMQAWERGGGHGTEGSG